MDDVRELRVRLILAGFICTTVLVLLIPAMGWAQDPGGSSSSGQSTPASAGPVPAARAGVIGALATGDSSTAGDDGAATNSSALPVQELGRAGWLGPTLSPLHWGSFYIGSFQFVEGYNDVRSGFLGNGIFRSSLFQTNVVYDTAIRGSHLVFQWEPQIVILNGQFVNNLNGENLSLAYAAPLSPRLTVTVQERLNYLPINNVYADSILSPSATADLNSIQNAFLQSPGSWLNDTVSADFAYQLTEGTRLIVSPVFNYVHSFNPSSAIALGSDQYGGSVTLNHRLSDTKTVGLFYSANQVKFDNSALPVIYESFGGSFIDQVSQSWFVNASLAAAPSTFGGPGTLWSMSGSVDVQKHFASSTAALAYSRGLNLNQYSLRQFTDRVDLSYGIQLTSKASASAGIGYQTAPGPVALSGEYASAVVGYHLLPSLVTSVTYAYGSQLGDNVQVYTQTRNTFSLALSWIPPRLY